MVGKHVRWNGFRNLADNALISVEAELYASNRAAVGTLQTKCVMEVAESAVQTRVWRMERHFWRTWHHPSNGLCPTAARRNTMIVGTGVATRTRILAGTNYEQRQFERHRVQFSTFQSAWNSSLCCSGLDVEQSALNSATIRL